MCPALPHWLPRPPAIPIAKVATKIAIGYTLDEITNDVTGKTCACFEPALDYIVVKYPKWPFDKFVYADKSLGTQMMATGEVMSIGNSFEAAMMKAVSSIELGMDTLTHKPFEELTDDEIVAHMHVQDAERVFCVYEALKRGIDHRPSTTSPRSTGGSWTRCSIWQIWKTVWRSATASCLKSSTKTAKKYGFQDKTIKRLAQVDTLPVENYRAGFKMVDTCAAEFSANTPYFYSTYDGDNEAAEFIAEKEAKAAQRASPKEEGAGLWFRPHPHWSGHRVRLLLGALRLDPEKARLRGHPGQQQPRDRLHRL